MVKTKPLIQPMFTHFQRESSMPLKEEEYLFTFGWSQLGDLVVDLHKLKWGEGGLNLHESGQRILRGLPYLW